MRPRHHLFRYILRRVPGRPPIRRRTVMPAKPLRLLAVLLLLQVAMRGGAHAVNWLVPVWPSSRGARSRRPGY